LRRSVANTDRDGNGNSGCKRYAYCDGNSNCYCDSNTDAHTYSHAKDYPDAQSSADPGPAPDPALVTLTCPS